MKALFKSAKKLLKSNGKAFKVYTVVFVVYPYFCTDYCNCCSCCVSVLRKLDLIGQFKLVMWVWPGDT